MIGIEVFEEEFADVFADGGFDEFEVFGVVVGAKGGAEEGVEAFSDVVGEPVAFEDGDDVVFVGGEGGVGDLGEVVGEGFALVGEDEAGFVEGVAAKHAADCVGDEFL